ncbi:DUF3110 domain-containing protein [Aetokthonos hydrillicola Thurmond2011]|jgi:hypothetical protein|uniref:DUF3110 domain-containing protein n=1 Tax=Aetokthonos hydrillicola Thurmond2011 TaxID=2712845 RepID=A0AAP5M9X4_9CYAN|nr:DUF3110 domain-containing protein [Aetokthonos hydrillicola]MBO3458807.1 DUF3110 domain-containing protein [Aetokthonos hydrillicola CCALA 1050]MBW4585553.1 DUF3110 domain-containing protein [Aetokthonos hydrillicola CCALA 1050]MDR9896177.1 DUF3110 domain-containing protein [Aetokthonos hydrillicola Thurmond2011]
MRVFVLLFNARTDNEGIHSIREGDRDKILMFESEDDATRFALMLEAQDFRSPTVEAMDDEEIKLFCKEAGYNWEIVPTNSNELAIPPEFNLEQPDWQPDAKKDETGRETSQPNQESQEKQELSNSELDSIRRKLEGLL